MRKLWTIVGCVMIFSLGLVAGICLNRAGWLTGAKQPQLLTAGNGTRCPPGYPCQTVIYELQHGGGEANLVVYPHDTISVRRPSAEGNSSGLVMRFADNNVCAYGADKSTCTIIATQEMSTSFHCDQSADNYSCTDPGLQVRSAPGRPIRK